MFTWCIFFCHMQRPQGQLLALTKQSHTTSSAICKGHRANQLGLGNTNAHDLPTIVSATLPMKRSFKDSQGELHWRHNSPSSVMCILVPCSVAQP